MLDIRSLDEVHQCSIFGKAVGLGKLHVSVNTLPPADENKLVLLFGLLVLSPTTPDQAWPRKLLIRMSGAIESTAICR